MPHPADTPHGSVVLQGVPSVLIHHSPHQRQVRVAGDVSVERAGAVAGRVVGALGGPTLVELDLSRVTHIGLRAVQRIARILQATSDELTQLVVRVRPGPVAYLLEEAGLAEEDGGPATIVAGRVAVRPPDAATEVVMRFYEALARRDWLGLGELVADDARWSVPTLGGQLPPPDRRDIVDFHTRAVEAIPGVRPVVATTESDGRTVLARGSHVVPATDGDAAFRHRWHVAGDQLVGFSEQVDAASYERLRDLPAL